MPKPGFLQVEENLPATQKFLDAMTGILSAEGRALFQAAIDAENDNAQRAGYDAGYGDGHSDGYDDGLNAVEFDHDDAIENARMESFDEGYAQGRADATSEEHD